MHKVIVSVSLLGLHEISLGPWIVGHQGIGPKGSPQDPTSLLDGTCPNSGLSNNGHNVGHDSSYGDMRIPHFTSYFRRGVCEGYVDGPDGPRSEPSIS